MNIAGDGPGLDEKDLTSKKTTPVPTPRVEKTPRNAVVPIDARTPTPRTTPVANVRPT